MNTPDDPNERPRPDDDEPTDNGDGDQPVDPPDNQGGGGELGGEEDTPGWSTSSDSVGS